MNVLHNVNERGHYSGTRLAKCCIICVGPFFKSICVAIIEIN